MKAAILFGALLCAGCAPAAHNVKYVVQGDPMWPSDGSTGPRVHIVMSNDQGGTEMSEVMAPFGNEFTTGSGAFLYVSGQAEQGTQVSCDIYVDGRPFRHSQSTGDYAIATCSGRP